MSGIIGLSTNGRKALKARSISAWGNAPGLGSSRVPRAEGPLYSSSLNRAIRLSSAARTVPSDLVRWGELFARPREPASNRTFISFNLTAPAKRPKLSDAPPWPHPYVWLRSSEIQRSNYIWTLLKYLICLLSTYKLLRLGLGLNSGTPCPIQREEPLQ